MVKCELCKATYEDEKECEPIKGIIYQARGYTICQKHADEYMKELLKKHKEESKSE